VIDHVLEACRLVNVPLAVLVAGGFFVRINDMWARYGLGGRLLRAGLLVLLLVVAAGSAEAYVTHAAVGYRIAGLTVALLISATGLLLIHRDPDQL
jgi:uncharacterized RDD family membrane protein YckC